MSRYDLDREQLSELLAGEPTYRVDQLHDGLYERLLEPGEITELPRALRERLSHAPEMAPAFKCVAETIADRGTTIKWLLEAADTKRIETVLMSYRSRTTVCVSSQAGCAMGCAFCATGDAGFGRQLSSGEIVEQVVLAARRSELEGWGRVGNVVFMGMGEPFANFDALWRAVEVINGDLGLAARHLTISTVGVVPGIMRLADKALQVNLAVSLHAGNDTMRDRLVPLNRRYPLRRVMEACAHYRARTGRRVSFEWACIAGLNDRRSDAEELAALALGLGAHVNVIPLNPTPATSGRGLRGSSTAEIAAFVGWLERAGVNVTVRQSRGRSIGAACGQLAAVEPPTAER
jgi:23S rRNA (adenine2503-C2)-methyltransferase